MSNELVKRPNDLIGSVGNWVKFIRHLTADSPRKKTVISTYFCRDGNQRSSGSLNIEDSRSTQTFKNRPAKRLSNVARDVIRYDRTTVPAGPRHHYCQRLRKICVTTISKKKQWDLWTKVMLR